MIECDVLVLGAGGAGMMCAATAARRGRRVIVLDHAENPGRKILISGGGRCNFTNLGAEASSYLSENPHFAKSALSRYRPERFLELVRKHGVPFYEKKLGQLFCRDSAQRIVDLLAAECREAGADVRLRHTIESVDREDGRFLVHTNRGVYGSESLVVATGGLSIPRIGATDFGHRLARKFGLRVTDLAPALVQLRMDPGFLAAWKSVVGLSLDVEAECRGTRWRENLLFTHQGISGPVILQTSLLWREGDAIFVDLAPGRAVEQELLEKKRAGSRAELKNVLAEIFPRSFAAVFTEELGGASVCEISDSALRRLASRLHRWELRPVGTGGYGKAEVTRGGVSTEELSSKTMEALQVPGLFFIGEVVDVTGMLGGYNLHWAWASGHAAGAAC
ncbi:MAG: NAD(P)/FAD-dependent oxidoreductase [Bdellovibrionales bacterium]|nr:NAD(P)/FAD-dependent oxidoreductase [Bdellovibrionales bacterium]